MKTLLHRAPGIRAFFAALFLFTSSILPAAAEWITLQIPLTMASRSFTFWEEGSDGGTILPLGVPADQLGYHLGDYSLRTSGVPILMGGAIDGNGMWHPNGSSYAMISALRQGTGMFFLRDETTNQLSPPDQTALLYADWRTLDATAPLRFVAVNESRQSHLLAFVSSNCFIPLTNGAVQKAIGNDGQEYSLGFFNAWATGIDPVEFGYPNGRIVDLTAQEAAWGAPNLTDSAAWWVDSTPYSVQPLSLVFSESESGRQFDVYAGGSVTQVTANWTPNTPSTGLAEGGPISVGSGIEFRVVRVGSNGAPDGETGWHQMPPSSHTFNASQELPAPTGGFTMTTLNFRISSSLNPWGFHVWSAAQGDSFPLGVSDWENTTVIDYPGTNTPITLSYRDAWVDVDVSAGYVVIDSFSLPINDGPDFFDFPPVGSIPSLVLPASIPVARQGHGMRTVEGFDAIWSGTVGQAQAYDPFGNPAGQSYVYNVASLSVPFSPAFFAESNPMLLTDLDRGEGSPPGSFLSLSIAGMQAWHVSQPLILKISGSRWSNSLEVRCADGRVVPVVRRRLQGDWSTDPFTGVPWFNPYGFFDATAAYQANIPWHLYDVTRNQYLNADGSDPASFINATDNTDTDGDGLKDWYEILIGTNPNNPNTDGDTEGNDGYEVTHGTNPLAKPVTASGATLKVFTPLEP